MLFYSIEGYGHTADVKRKLLSESTPLCRGNVQSLKMMIPLFATAERCVSGVYPILLKVRT